MCLVKLQWLSFSIFIATTLAGAAVLSFLDIHSFIQETVTEHLLCSKHSSRFPDHSTEQVGESLFLCSFFFSLEEEKDNHV